MTRVSSVLGVHPAPEPSNLVKISGQAAGGGRITAKRNADYIHMEAINYEQKQIESSGRAGG
jgi:hypothetical protein